MFDFFSNLGANATTGVSNALSGLTDQPRRVGEQIDLVASDPMAFISKVTGFEHLKALTQSPEDYQKYLAQNPQAFAPPPAMEPLPQLPFQPVPLAPTGGFVGQSPNYLNNAQQALRGPYG